MGIWPSPKCVTLWLQKKWHVLFKGSLNHLFCGQGFYAFLFKNKEDYDLIFRSGPYFLGAKGMHLKKWIPNFKLENDVPSIVPVLVHFSHLPLHYWSDDALRCIRNPLGKYIDWAVPKENIFSYA